MHEYELLFETHVPLLPHGLLKHGGIKVSQFKPVVPFFEQNQIKECLIILRCHFFRLPGEQMHL